MCHKQVARRRQFSTVRGLPPQHISIKRHPEPLVASWSPLPTAPSIGYWRRGDGGDGGQKIWAALSSICLRSVSNFYAHVARNHRKPQVVKARLPRLVRHAEEEEYEGKGERWQHTQAQAQIQAAALAHLPPERSGAALIELH